MKTSTDYDIINNKHFFELINKPGELTPEETKRVQEFSEFANNLLKYKDYLLDQQKEHIDTYERGINYLTTLEQEHPEAQLNTKQKYAIEQYQKNKQYLDELKSGKIRVLQKNNDVSPGYANSFILILSVLATGIVIGIILFMIIK